MTQIKLGFDKLPVPSITTYNPLYDIVKGVPLRDENNNVIVTEVEGPVDSLADSRKATSVFINNDYTRALPVEEQFPDTSEVSTTLLGIPRAEVQLSLFSDVSTYGLNPEEFEFFDFNSYPTPGGWYTRRNATYGNHYYTRLREVTNEQALAIEAFPVPYTFSPGPRWSVPYTGIPSESYLRFVKFVQLGNQLYDEYKTNYLDFANKKFLNPEYVYVADNEVKYRVDEQTGYDLIDVWTVAWMDIRDRLLYNPKSPGQLITFPDGYGADETRPGASSTQRYFGILQSKKAYRYQPGRISGFTFGFRCSTDEKSVDNIIEWGIGNPTDQYIFQVRGAAFNIVRRSTVPLTVEALEAQGLTESSQVLKASDDPINGIQFYETVISRDNFNGDPLDGTGRSGYLLNPIKLTMYKIEFGWYGAIGAKFYAYVPSAYGDARWVLMHTLVIENKLNEPCLEDSYFKFRYSINIKDTSNLRSPQYLYKYGASCYIDGGDNSAAKIHSYSSDDNLVNNTKPTPLLGIYPKQSILNRDAYAKPNKINLYPSSLKVSADQLTQIQIVEVQGCPAFGHHYAPSLHAKQNGIVRAIESISGDGTQITITQDSTPFTEADEDAKLIGSGIWSGYIQYNNSTVANVKRIGFAGYYQKSFDVGLPSEVNLGNNITLLNEVDLSAVRFSNYDAIATAEYPLTGDVIDVNFLNPIAYESTGQCAEFLIGLTEFKPVQVQEQDPEGNPIQVLKFLKKDGITLVDQKLDDLIYEEFTQLGVDRDRDGYETNEAVWYWGSRMSIDYRLPQPAGVDTGYCSGIRFIIQPRISFSTQYVNVNPLTNQPSNCLIFSSRPAELISDNFNLIGGEFGLGTNAATAIASGIKFTSNVNEFISDPVEGTVSYFVEIDAALSEPQNLIWVSPVGITDRTQITFGDEFVDPKNISKTKIFSFELKPLYIVIRLRDNAKINNVTITEAINLVSNSFCPEWITNNKLDVITSGGSQTGAPAANYESKNRLESASIDVSVKQPLRPYTVKDTLYVAPNSNSEITLENIYGSDRTTITPGLLNTKATFVTAKSMVNNDVNIVSINVNTKEE